MVRDPRSKGTLEINRQRTLTMIEARKAGLSWNQIGDKFDIDPKDARRKVDRFKYWARKKAAEADNAVSQ